MAYGIFGVITTGVSSGEGGGDILGGNEQETALNQAAEEDLDALASEEGAEGPHLALGR